MKQQQMGEMSSEIAASATHNIKTLFIKQSKSRGPELGTFICRHLAATGGSDSCADLGRHFLFRAINAV